MIGKKCGKRYKKYGVVELVLLVWLVLYFIDFKFVLFSKKIVWDWFMDYRYLRV